MRSISKIEEFSYCLDCINTEVCTFTIIVEQCNMVTCSFFLSKTMPYIQGTKEQFLSYFPCGIIFTGRKNAIICQMLLMYF